MAFLIRVCVAFVAVMALSAPAISQDAAEEAAPQKPAAQNAKQVYGFYLGIPRILVGKTPQKYGGDFPDEDVPEYPNMTVYLVGTVDPNAPIGPPRMIPTDKGERFLPPHQLVHPVMATKDNPYEAYGAFVIPGPKASEDTLKTDPFVENSVTGTALATHIKMGWLWVPLDNHLAIEYGLKAEILDLYDFEKGGLQWTEPLDKDQPDYIAQAVAEETAAAE